MKPLSSWAPQGAVVGLGRFARRTMWNQTSAPAIMVLEGDGPRPLVACARERVIDGPEIHGVLSVGLDDRPHRTFGNVLQAGGEALRRDLC